MAELGTEIKGGVAAAKAHWVTVLVIGLGLVVLALWYDHKNNGKLTVKLAGLPVLGKLFA